MRRSLKQVAVELSTPGGVFFAWRCGSVELRTVEGAVEINPSEGHYLSLLRATEITMRRGGQFHTFALENATAGLKDGTLVVLAERIRPLSQLPANSAAARSTHSAEKTSH